MREINWGKLAAVMGVVFAVTFVVGAMLAGGEIDQSDPDTKIVDWWSDGGHQTLVLIGGYLLVISAMAFVWFISQVQQRLAAFETGSHQLSTVAFGAGLLFAAMVLAAFALLAGPAGAAKFGNVGIPKDADILRQLPQAGFALLLVGGAWAAGLAMATISWASLRTGAFARWLAWVGFIAAILMLFGIVFLPMIALPIWVLAASVELWRKPLPAAA